MLSRSPQARELFAAFAAAEADKLIETKGQSASFALGEYGNSLARLAHM